MSNTFRRLISLILTAAMLFSLGAEAFADSLDTGGQGEDTGDVLTLPAALTEIGEEAFFGDNSIDEVVIPYGAAAIGPRAFAWSGLRRIYIPDTVTDIAGDAFEGTEATIVSSVDGYAHEHAVENGLSWESDGAYYINRAIGEFLPTIEQITDLGSILPENTDFTPESTEGVTEPELIALIEDYNAFLAEMERENAAYLAELDEVLGMFDSLVDSMLDAGLQPSGNGQMMEIEGISYYVPEDVTALFADDYEIVGTTTLDGGDIQIEVRSGEQTYYILQSDTGMTLMDQDDNILMLMALSDVLDSALARVRVIVTDIETWIDVVLEGAQDRMEARLNREEIRLTRLEENAEFIEKKSANLKKAGNIQRAAEIEARNELQISGQRTLVRNLGKFVAALTGIGAAWDAYQIRSSLDKINELLRIERHGHPTADDLSNPRKKDCASQMPDWLLTARRGFILDVVNNSLMFVTDLAALITNIALVVPGGQGYFVGGRVGIFATRASLAAVSTVLFASGFASAAAANILYNRVEEAERVLHNATEAGFVAGAVTNKGRPLSGVTVTLDGTRSVVTGEDGTYLMTDVELGEHTLATEAAGYKSAQKTVTVTLKSEPYDFAMEADAGSLFGKVTDSKTGAALAGVKVTLDLGDGQALTATTGADGVYSFEDIPFDMYTLSFEKLGYTPLPIVPITMNLVGNTEYNTTLKPEDDPDPDDPVDPSEWDQDFWAWCLKCFHGTWVEEYYLDGECIPGHWEYDGKLSREDILGVYCLNCSCCGFTSLKGIEQFKNLYSLDCSYNQLTSLNLSGCSALEDLNCSYNQLTSLNVSGCSKLTELRCYKNQLTSLNVSGCSSNIFVGRDDGVEVIR